MFKEYYVIRATHKLSEVVDKGSIGTILMVFDNPSLAYEVEFVNADGETLELLTVESTEIEIIKAFT